MLKRNKRKHFSNCSILNKTEKIIDHIKNKNDMQSATKNNNCS